MSQDRLSLGGTPYLLSATAADQVSERVKGIEERVALLRATGKLTEDTLRHFHGARRYEQVAESNAIEGSTLSAGETELAVQRGITITGHDPAYARDARSLDKALEHLSELARDQSATTNKHQLLSVHELLMGERPTAGSFRSERVMIRGAKHVPPKTSAAVAQAMDEWESWSLANKSLPAPLRSVVLHAWLTHIHPFLDGNGRSARAIGNLELIRAGYPSIIIRRIERDRYLDALGESDAAGDLRSFFELVLDRVEGAITGLERSAQASQGYSPTAEKIRKMQKLRLEVWSSSVDLLARIVEDKLTGELEPAHGTCNMRIYERTLELDEYIALCEKIAVPRSWAFSVSVNAPGLSPTSRLAYVGFRSAPMYHHLGDQGGPSIYWSTENPDGFPKWITDEQSAPYAVELTTKGGQGDEWYARLQNGAIEKRSTTEVAKLVCDSLVDQFAGR